LLSVKPPLLAGECPRPRLGLGGHHATAGWVAALVVAAPCSGAVLSAADRPHPHAGAGESCAADVRLPGDGSGAAWPTGVVGSVAGRGSVPQDLSRLFVSLPTVAS